MFHRNFFFQPHSPFDQFRRLSRQMDRLFGEIDEGLRFSPKAFPAIEVLQGETGLVLRAQVPGVAAENLELTVLGNEISLKGSRKGSHEEEGVRMHRQERPAGEFLRTLELPYEVDPEKVDAHLKDGILTVRLERPAKDLPKKITVTVESDD